MKTTKKSALMSVMAILLCLTMLLGTTWAWFTDSVTSSGNKIQAGSLKLDLEMLDKETGEYVSIKKDKSPIFNYNKWEPGYTDVKFLKVENEGTLALKWKAVFVSEGEISKLAEVIDVWVKPSATELSYSSERDSISVENGWQNVGTLDKFINTLSETTYGNLLPNTCAYLGIALHMQEEAGNDYQEIGLEAFDIQIIATQMSSEDDSFGDDYDNDAEWGDVMNFTATQSLDGVSIINNELAEEVTIRHESGAYAIVPAGVKLADGVTELKFSGKGLDSTDGNFAEGSKNYDIHIEGIADDNTKSITVFIGQILDAGLGETELKLYHEDVQMTRVNSVGDFQTYDQFTYDAETGAVVLYVKNFSVFSGVTSTPDVWDGEAVATGFASGTGTEADPYIIETAAQLVYFRNQVDTGVTYKDQFVKLNADIDLNNKLFDPIGFGYAHNGGQAFMGTFDGQKHTIYGLYQNGWDLDPDKTNYSKYTYSTAGGGLFASIKDATIKNLGISGANIVFECVDIGILVGYAQGQCTFDNIIVTNSKIANYNRYTGGLVGEVCKGDDVDESEYTHTFNNITIDSSVVVSSLWGSFDTGIGGVIGGKWGTARVSMTNVTVAAELDVFSDVTAAYQWYAYRRAGMLIGHTEQNSPKSALNADAPFLTCENVVVYYGEWVNYTYYEFAEQDTDKGERYPWVRAEAGLNNGAFSNPRYGNPIVDGVTINTEELAEEYCTSKVTITFNQLYGGGQGVYGKADHTSVTTNNLNETKTIYFQNTSGWTDLKLMYHYKNGDNTWTTVVEGIDLGAAFDEQGIYDIYKVTVPSDAYAFTIIGANDGETTPEIKLDGLVEGDLYSIGTDDEINHCAYDGKYKTIYFQNNWLWSDVYIYYWYSESETKSWDDFAFPGKAMTKVSNDGTYDIYKIEIPSYATGINFSNGIDVGTDGHKQSIDIEISTVTSGYIYSMYWHDDTNDVISYEYKSGYTAVLFQNYWKWNNVTCYYWTSTTDNSWPGKSMSKIGTLGDRDLYIFYLPKNVTGVIFVGNNNTDGGQQQTVDITEFVNGRIYTHNSWSDGKVSVNILN